MQGWQAAGCIIPTPASFPAEHDAAQPRSPAPRPSTAPPAQMALKAHALCTEPWRHDSYLFNLELNNFGSVNKKYLESFKKCQIKSEWTVIKADVTFLQNHDWRLSIHKTQGKKKAKALLKLTTRWGVSIARKQRSHNEALYPPCKHFKVSGKIFWKRKRDVL